jgi:CO/xanthine dehydrogenase FAD-binding subunit
MVNHYVAKNKKEALDHMKRTMCLPVAGGTDFTIKHRRGAGAGVASDKPLLFIGDLEELRFVSVERETIRIGAATPLETIADHPLMPAMIKDVIETMASPGIRHTATLAGNIQNASPAGDSLLFLYLLNAVLVLESADNTHRVRIDEFISAPGSTGLKTDELITEIIMDHPAFTMHAFTKAGGRKADTISKLSFLGAATVDQKNITDFRVCFGAVYKTVIRDKPFETSLIQNTTSQFKKLKDDIHGHYASLISPITDQRSTADYRKKASLRLLDAFLDDIV